jgi:hypothetical protein
MPLIPLMPVSPYATHASYASLAFKPPSLHGLPSLMPLKCLIHRADYPSCLKNLIFHALNASKSSSAKAWRRRWLRSCGKVTWPLRGPSTTKSTPKLGCKSTSRPCRPTPAPWSFSTPPSLLMYLIPDKPSGQRPLCHLRGCRRHFVKNETFIYTR